jgi:DNA-binding LacI/PurR family transcriptional regulator
VTLRDVARRAGVDVSTASRALSGRRHVTEPLAVRVQRAAEAQGYSPNQAARSLRLARTLTLGIVFGRLQSPISLELLEGLGSRADEAGYSLMVTVARGAPEQYRTLVRRLFERRVDGLFVASPPELGDALAPFDAAGAPVVALVRRGPDTEDLPLVTASEERAVHQAVSRLRALGHRRLLYLGVPEAIPSARLDWLLAAAAAHGCVLEPVVTSQDSGTAELEAHIAQALRRSAATAVFFEYSEAVRMLHAFQRLGLVMPRDLSAVAFGESSWSSGLGSALSSIRHDLISLGRIAAQTMLDRLAGAADVELVEAGIAEWVERASVGLAPPAPWR